jgi:multidrug efflux system outer membrane protein
MKLPTILRTVAVIAGLTGVIGCTLGPEPERPTTTADVSDTWVYAPEAETVSLPEVAPWWREFGDQTTTELVELALENNPDLQAAAARVIEAEAALRRAGGARLPQVGYGASASKQQMSFVLPNVGRRQIESTTYSYNFNISWQADLFGRLKRTQQSAWASMLAEEAAREAVVHSVVAGVVRARVLVATAAWALDITQQITASWESTTRTVERRYRAGIAGAVELHLARENLASARAAEAVIEGQLEQARLALDVLVGRRPGSAEMLPSTMPQLPSLEPVPLGLPAALLDRRPDLRQAELQLSAATYGVGAAVANLYPDLSLTGSVGSSADKLNDLTISDGLVYSAIANLVGPLFTGGQRRADVDAAKARADQATAMYAGAVLNALREVEEALVLGEVTSAASKHCSPSWKPSVACASPSRPSSPTRPMCGTPASTFSWPSAATGARISLVPRRPEAPKPKQETKNQLLKRCCDVCQNPQARCPCDCPGCRRCRGGADCFREEGAATGGSSGARTAGRGDGDSGLRHPCRHQRQR